MRIIILRTLCVMLLCGCFGIPTALPSYGEPTMNGHPPLAQKFGSKPGAYDLVIRVSQPILDPGDKLQVEVYISGYGVIGAAKVVYYPSPEVFDYAKSKLMWGPNTYDDGGLGWGGRPVPLSDPSYSTGGTLTFSGGVNEPGNPQWKEQTWFFDGKRNQDGDYQIYTEVKDPRGTAPVYLDLAIARNVKPGPHSIQFVLTYFDGQTWKTASQNADFTIRNFYQRHEGIIWWIGGPLGFLAAVTTIAAGIITLWPFVRTHWPISVVVAALGGIAAGGGKAISERRKRSRAKCG